MEALGEDGRARYDERHKIPYTFAVLMEAQNSISSIVPLSTTRRASQAIHINGYVIPQRFGHMRQSMGGLHATTQAIGISLKSFCQRDI
ncbi:hypothetical protein CEXT_569081 [Caerostris extrusa]|uniref:Uncharacterized protein n=1 Tax=Caerostris extrusa TaxID=172846 RepID=A0AAV4W5P0_CAEEX|nr:hypothetical protein CEXT_569081 [Caerostris extrusa]